MKKNKKIIVFNWKMEPSSFREVEKLCKQLTILNSDIVIAPPFIYLHYLSKLKFSKISLCGQDCFWKNEGAYTGEISPLMLKNLGVKYVIIGHSERRTYLKETDEMIGKKVNAAVENNLIPILCVGETLEQRKKGLTKKIIKNQLERDLKSIHNSKFIIHYSNFIVAYEPLWAIGTGKTCSVKKALEMTKFIKSFIIHYSSFAVPVLYGGSVDSQNIMDFLNCPDIDGVLIGGASVKVKEIKKIIKNLKH